MYLVLEFKKLSLEHIKTIRPFFMDNHCRICDCTIGATFMWRDYHNTEFAIEDGILFLKVTHPELAFAPPRGVDVNIGSYERIIGYCDGQNSPTEIRSVSRTVLEGLLEMFPGSQVRTERDWSDYLYLSDDLKSLSGRRFAGQRNHINHFIREYPGWAFERVAADNIADARQFIEKNAQENVKESLIYIEGCRKALEALDNYELYDQLGGILYVNGNVVGVSLGEITGDTLYIHTEKADVAYQGSYPMLMNQFAINFAAEDTVYINREEDDGVEGLRASKMSYHPVDLLEKYKVVLKR